MRLHIIELEGKGDVKSIGYITETDLKVTFVIILISGFIAGFVAAAIFG